MLAGDLQAVLLLNTEPVHDSAAGKAAAEVLGKAQMVVTFSPFKANLEFSDVLLPIAPFSETSGTFVNAEGRAQSFHAVVKPRGAARPAWKVLRVLANMLGLSGFEFDASTDVLAQVLAANATHVSADRLSNASAASVDLSASATREPVVASIYQLDGLVRRAPSLQLTADARERAAAATRSADQEVTA
jgi:NADH-quinone oxidoreductase subunit G